MPTLGDATTAGPQAGAIDVDLEAHRRELTGYCYRMLGSGFEAEDAVQETMMRAWRGIDRFEGRSALRSWLYRIATNVCLDMVAGPQRRARPMDLGPFSTADSALGPGLPETTWVQPVQDARVVPADGDPAAVAEARESIRLAFVAALQHLPPRQRAVLILREVLRRQASEVAELLETSVASVNSALQRARATLAQVHADSSGPSSVDAEHEQLLARYVDAFERYDITSLVSLLHEDATFSMPPYPLWLRGHVEISRWYVGQGIGCRGSKLIATAANGCAAFGSYKPAGQGTLEPFALQVVEVSGERISGLHHFLDPGCSWPSASRLACRADPRSPPKSWTSPTSSSSSRSRGQGSRRTTEAPRRRAARWSRASSSTSPRSGHRSVWMRVTSMPP